MSVYTPLTTYYERTTVLSNLIELKFITFLEHSSSSELFLFFGLELLFWMIFSLILVSLSPKKYKPYRKSIFVFFVVINFGLLFMGLLLTAIMIVVGFSWATSKNVKPTYEMLDVDSSMLDFPLVYSRFSEGILTIKNHHTLNISTQKKIKSLRILYESNAHGNIGKIKRFLSDDSDETRLYAFSLISAFEKKLNDGVKKLQQQIKEEPNKKEKENHHFLLAQMYWQFIYHGVANEQLAHFYTNKVEDTLKPIKHDANASMLLGKIYIFNKNYKKAERHFLKAVNLGVPQKVIHTYLAEIRYGQKAFNSVSNYMQEEEFVIDLRMKPLHTMWERNL